MAAQTPAVATDFVSWLFSDAGAGWVFGIVSLLVLAVSKLYGRKVKHVVLHEVETASLIDIRKEIRDRMHITYGGHEVHTLGFTQTEVFNPGLDVISNVVITFSLAAPSRLLDIAAVSSFNDCRVVTTLDLHVGTVSVPYLNSYRGHNHTVVIATTYDGNPADVRITGSAPGWSLKRISLRGKAAKTWRVVWPGLIVMGIACFGKFWYANWLLKKYGIEQTEVSTRAFVASLPLTVPMLGILIWLAFEPRQPRPRSSKETFDKLKSLNQAAS